MSYNWSSLDRYIGIPLREDVRAVLRTGLLISQAKDEHGNIDTDAAANTIALGLDAAFTAACPPSGPQKPDAAVENIWGMFLRVVGLVPRDDEPALAALLQGLGKLRTLRDRGVISDKGSSIGTKIWAELPYLGSEVREGFGGAFTCGPEPDDGVIAQYESHTAFLARANATVTPSWFTVESYGEFRDALETEPPGYAPKARSLLWACTEWILHTGEEIYEGIDDETPDAAYYGLAGLNAGPLFMAANAGRKGFTRDRWVFWRKRFGEISGTVGDEFLETRITEAMRIMDEISSSRGKKGRRKEEGEGQDEKKEMGGGK